MQNVSGKILATLINDYYVCWNSPLSKSSWAIEIVVSKGQVSTVSTLLRISERGFQQRKRCTLNICDWGDMANIQLVIFPILSLLFAASSGQSTMGKFLLILIYLLWIARCWSLSNQGEQSLELWRGHWAGTGSGLGSGGMSGQVPGRGIINHI